MSKPDDVTPEVEATARKALGRKKLTTRDSALRIAQCAILLERERCALIAEERAAICADAVDKIRAGALYQNIPTAEASENCARMEAAHIARLIRNDEGAIPNPASAGNPSTAARQSGTRRSGTANENPPVDTPAPDFRYRPVTTSVRRRG